MTDSNNNKKAPTGSQKAMPMSTLSINPFISQKWFIGLLIWVPAKPIQQVLKCTHIMALGFNSLFFSLRSVPQENSLLQSGDVFLAYLLTSGTSLRPLVKNKTKQKRAVLPYLTHNFSQLFGSNSEELICMQEPKAFWHHFSSEWLQITSLGCKPSLSPNLLLITLKQNQAALNTRVCLNEGSSWSEKREWLSSPRDKFSTFG